MKSYSVYIAIALAASLSLGSCSTVKGLFGGDKSESTSTVTSQAVKPDKNKKKKDRPTQPDSTAPKTSLTEKPTQQELSGGQWTVASVGDVTIEAEEDVPYVNFDTQGRFYASDGCNIINGTYALRSDGSMVFSNVLTTMKYCPDVEYSALIASLFNDDSKLGVDCRRIGQETYLYLKNASGNTVMTLRRHNMEFMNGNWLVTSIDGKKIDDEEANIFIDIAELKVHGNTGCNYFNGQIYIDPQRTNAIDFSNMGVTRMACPKGDQERLMLVALEETATAVAGKNEDTVLLLDKKGKEVMTLKRIPLTSTDNE